MQENILSVSNLCKQLKDFGIKNASFSVSSGKILGIVGRNGAGKTATLNLLTGLLKKTDGNITLCDINFDKSPEKYKQNIGFVADDGIFPANYTTKDIAKVYKSFYKTFDMQKFTGYLNRWNIPEKKAVKTFSHDIQIKLMLAVALSRDTKLLIIDEPQSGFEYATRIEILDILREYVKSGERCAIFATHITTDLDKTIDNLCFIDDGKLEICDTKENILAKYSLISGNRGDLTPEQKELVIGYKIFEPRFEAMIKSSDVPNFPASNFKNKSANIEQIVFYLIKAKQQMAVMKRDASQFDYNGEEE